MVRERAAPCALFAGLFCVAWAGHAFADEILLKNGDRITGKIVSADGGKVQITPDFAKTTTITLAQDDISTFTTTAPLVLKLKDGTTINQSVREGPVGQVVIAADGPLAPQPVQLSQITVINPAVAPPVAWHGTVGVNGLYSDSSATSLLFGFSASGTRKTDADQLTVNAAYNYGQQTADHENTTNANNWAAGAKYDFFVLPKVYAYGDLQTAGDRVNFLNLRFTPSVGGGYKWADFPDFHLTTDAGLAYIYEDYSTEKSATKDVALSLSYHIDKSWDTNRISLFHDLRVLPSLQGGDVLVITDAGLRTALTKTMYSEIRADVTYDSQPAPEAKSTTALLKIGLGWTY